MSAGLRVLVTGAGGHLGGHVAQLLASGGNQVYGTTRHAGKAPRSGLQWLTCDFSKPGDVRAAVASARPSLVIHTIGLAGTTDADALNETNVGSLAHLIDALEGAGPIERLLVMGSSAEYATGGDREPIREDHPLGPSSPYGTSKLRQFELSQSALQRGLPVVYARPFNLIGPGASCATAVGDISKRMADAMRAGGSKVVEVGDLDRWRDYLDVRDAAEACKVLLESASPGGVYNICSGVPVLMADVVDRLLALAGGNVSLRKVESAASPRFVVGDPSKLRGLGWAPKHDLETSLREGLQDVASRL
jgi:GDP-4-dehydro-6-deoxy-D-mannose reductase